jgi:hypothetical protein
MLAGGLITVIASNQAQAGPSHIKCHGDHDSDLGDLC